MADEDAVFVLQRHHVGHRTQGRQRHGVEQALAEARRDLVGAAGALAQRPRQLERHPRAGQAAERVGPIAEPGVDEHGGVWQALPRLVVVSDD